MLGHTTIHFDMSGRHASETEMDMGACLPEYQLPEYLLHGAVTAPAPAWRDQGRSHSRVRSQ